MFRNVIYVLFLRTVGVGFSYSEQEDPLAQGGDYHTDDSIAAKDNYALVQAFLDRFPQYRKNDVSKSLLSLLFTSLCYERLLIVYFHLCAMTDAMLVLRFVLFILACTILTICLF